MSWQKSLQMRMVPWLPASVIFIMTMNTLPTVNSTHHLSAEQENIQKQEEAQQEV